MGDDKYCSHQMLLVPFITTAKNKTRWYNNSEKSFYEQRRFTRLNENDLFIL